MSLTILVYNLKRGINILGVKDSRAVVGEKGILPCRYKVEMTDIPMTSYAWFEDNSSSSEAFAEPPSMTGLIATQRTRNS